MKALGIAGLALLVATIPLAQNCIGSFGQYAKAQRQAEQEAIGCANTICPGLGFTALEASQNFDASMRYLMASLLMAPVGAVFTGLNWRDLVEQ